MRLLPNPFRKAYAEDLLLALQDWQSDSAPPTNQQFNQRSFPPKITRATWFLLRTAFQERIKPTVRAHRPGPREGNASMLDLLFQDLRHSLRALAKRPGFTVIGLLTLAVGVGANTAIFSVVNAVVLRPLPYPDSHALVHIERSETTRPEHRNSMSQPDLEDIGEVATSLEKVAGYQPTSVTLTGQGDPEVLSAAALTDGLLHIFRMPPSQGRDLSAADNLLQGPKVVVISDALLNSHLHGARDVIGQTMLLDGANYEIVGVAPPGFRFPREALLWIPLFNDPEGCARGCRLLTGVSRIAEGHDRANVQAELDTLAARLSEDFPDSNLETLFAATELQRSLLGETQRGLLILLGAVGLVLLIAAANLASLQIARSTGRKTEIGVRAALGATQARLCTMILLETVLLGIGGAILGAALGTAATKLVVALAPANVPRLDEASLDLRVLGFALTISLGVSLLFALLPAWRTAAGTGQTRRATANRADIRSRNFLMVGEVALSLVLLIGAGLLFKTYDRLLAVDLGFEEHGLHSFFVSLPDEPYIDPEKTIMFFDTLEQELASVPGVESVGSVLGRPFGRNNFSASFELLDQPEPPPGEGIAAPTRVVTPGFNRTFQIPVLSGRALRDSDRREGTGVAMVNQAFVDKFSNNQDPIGREIQLHMSLGFDDDPVRTIVGVIGNTRGSNPSKENPGIFVPEAQMASPWMSVVVRTTGPLSWPAIHAAVQRVDANIPLRQKETLVEAIDRARGPARFYLVLLGGFAVIAVFLAAIGLYGVVSYLVSRRTREIAIRLAVGATSTNVVRHVLGQGLKPVILGVALGLVVSALGARLLGSLLYEVKPFDPATYATVSVGLILVALSAIFVPAQRAGRVPPARALKEE